MSERTPPSTAEEPRVARRRARTIQLVALWSVLCAAGVWTLVRYEATPAAVTAVAPATWPAESRFPRAANRAVLLTFLHPYCPCSRATLEEVDKIVARHGAAADVRVVIVRPVGAPAAWAKAPLVASARALPGVTVVDDEDGVEAARFGATTSGATVLYGRDGRLLFHGGITISRGHVGGNPGEDAVVQCLTDGRPERDEAPVFGCPLQDDRVAAACPAPNADGGTQR